MQTAAAHWPAWSDTRTGEECGKELNIPGIARPRPGHSAHIVARRGRNAIVLCLGGRRQHLVSPRHGDRELRHKPGTEYSYVCCVCDYNNVSLYCRGRVPCLHPGDGRDGDISYLMTKIFEAGRKYLNSISAMYGRDHVPCAWRRRGAGRVKESGVAV